MGWTVLSTGIVRYPTRWPLGVVVGILRERWNSPSFVDASMLPVYAHPAADGTRASVERRSPTTGFALSSVSQRDSTCGALLCILPDQADNLSLEVSEVAQFVRVEVVARVLTSRLNKIPIGCAKKVSYLIVLQVERIPDSLASRAPRSLEYGVDDTCFVDDEVPAP